MPWTASSSVHGQHTHGPLVTFAGGGGGGGGSGFPQFGSYIPIRSGETQTTAATRFNTNLGAPNPAAVGSAGNIQCGRCYDFVTAGHSSGSDALLYQAAGMGAGVIPLACSLSNFMGSHIKNGDYKAQESVVQACLTYFNSVATATAPIDFTLRHEPDVQFKEGNFTPTEWYPAQNWFDGLITANGNPHVVSVIIWGGGSNDSDVTTRVNDYYPNVNPVVKHYLDPYAQTVTQTANGHIVPMLQALQAASGVTRCAIGETGIKDGSTDAEFLAWVQSFSVLQTFPGLEQVDWFNSGGTIIDTVPDSAAAYENLILA